MPLLPLFLNEEEEEEISILVVGKYKEDDIMSPISIFIEDQLPEFVALNHGGFVEFVEEYFKWSEDSAGGNPKFEAFNMINTGDIDNTADSFVKEFKNQFLIHFPLELESGIDQRKLIKNIKQFYRAKGTEQSYKLLFRILFDEDSGFYYPREDILKLSDGNWTESKIIKLTTTNDIDDIFSIVGRKIQQRNRTTNAIESYGFVEGILVYTKNGYAVTEVELSGVFGDFFPEGTVECDIGDGNVIYEYMYPTLKTVTVTSGGSNYSVQDGVEVITSNMGIGATARIESVDVDGSIKSIIFTNSGINYRESDTVTLDIDSVGGTGAVLNVVGGGAIDSRIGFWENNKGLLSSNKKLQDNFYYQNFSYAIQSSKTFDDFADLTQKIIHPAGTKMFSNTILKEIKAISLQKTDENNVYETPIVGHYAPYNFNTIRNLRGNGSGGSGGTDLYPLGYGWNSASGGVVVGEDGASSHTPGASGPLGGSTHEDGYDNVHATVDGETHPVYEQDIMQGEQFNVVNSGISGSTFGSHWLVYPHPNSRGITNIPWTRTKNIYDLDVPLGSSFQVSEYVYQIIPYSQDSIGVIISTQTTSEYNVLTIDNLSGTFIPSGEAGIGGTTGFLVGSSSDVEASIENVNTSPIDSQTSNKFNYIQLEDFLLGIGK